MNVTEYLGDDETVLSFLEGDKRYNRRRHRSVVPGSYQIRRQRAALMKKEMERKYNEKNFLFLHRQTIHKICNQVFEKRGEEIIKMKKGIKVWTTIIHMVRMGKKYFNLYDVT